MLKKQNSAIDSVELSKLLRDHSENILVPFSPAHVQDLVKGFEDPNNAILIRKDLDFLDQISRKNCLQFDYQRGMVAPFIGSAHDLFDSFCETKPEILLNPIEFENSMIDTAPDLSRLIISIWKNTPVDLKLETFGIDQNTIEFYQKYFRRTIQENTLFNLMVDFSEFYPILNSNPLIYKNLIEIFRSQIGLDPRVISNLDKPFDQLNDILSKSKFGFNLDDFTTINSKDPNKLINNDLSKYSLEYIGLDMAGFHPDTLTHKNLFSNFTVDSYHSFYGGHCDYFVSYDKKLISKSRSLYSKYGIETKALSPREFINEVIQIVQDEFTAKYLIDSIITTLDNCLVKEILKHYYQDSKVFLYRPRLPILAYFNYLQLKKNPKGRSTIFLFRDFRNFSGFIFYAEIESVINKCINIFGPDINGKTSFIGEEMEPFHNSKWGGRIWLFDKYLIELIYFEEINSLELIIEEITDDFLSSIEEMH